MTGGGRAALAEAAPAKVNLFLHVTGKRADGYHLLDSLVVFAGIADRITFESSDALHLTVVGPFAPALAAEENNLVLRAARALAGVVGVRPTGAMTLEKHIPVASGIGGGSADAAAALRVLCRAWNVRPDAEQLNRIALTLGADVPVCLRSRPALMRGVGETLTPAPRLPPCGLVLVNPGVPLATVPVFRAFTGPFSSPAKLPEAWDSAREMAAALAILTNDLETPAVSLAPSISDVARAIAASPGCLLARMSGSGATCFGLFASADEAETAATGLRRPGWWCWGGALAGE